MIDWNSLETHFFLNPRLSDPDRKKIENAREELPELPGHLWILTSGSSSVNSLKLVALSKKAFLASAGAVNDHLQSTAADRWLAALPTFHVGGLSIYARAHLSGAEVFEWLGPWDPAKYATKVAEDKITLSSLVPTQLYDLVKQEIPCPPTLRALFIGGGHLAAELFSKADELGYPILTTYGMTETCSQVAVSSLESPELKPLGHAEIKTDVDGRIWIKAESLMTGVCEISDTETKFYSPVVDGWFKTEDVGIFEKGVLTVFGRSSDQVKVSGELVLLTRLQSLISSYLPKAVVMAHPDQRTGSHICLVLPQSEAGKPTIDAVTEFNTQVAPFEKIRSVYFLGHLPTTELGKVKFAEISVILGV